MQKNISLYDVAHIIIEEVCPEELNLFDHFVKRFEEDFNVNYTMVTDSREGGMGLNFESIVLTYVVLKLLKEVVSPFWEGAISGIEELTKESVIELLTPQREKIVKWIRSLKRKHGESKKIARLENFVENREGEHSS